MVFAGRTGQHLAEEPLPHIASSFPKHPSPTRELRGLGIYHTVWFGFCPQPCTEPLLPRSRASHM